MLFLDEANEVSEPHRYQGVTLAIVETNRQGIIISLSPKASELLRIPSGTCDVHLDSLPQHFKMDILFQDNAKIGYVVCEGATLHDIKTRYKEELVELEHRTNSFAMITHDLKTPLNSISLLAQSLLQKTSLGNEQRIESANLIIQSCQLMTELVKNVLDSTKFDQGELKLESRAFNPLQVIERSVLLSAIPALHHGIDIAIDCPVLVDQVIGDDIRFQQILTNLVGNAVKFTKSGSIIVKVEKLSEYPTMKLKITIVDTGIGIDEKNYDKLFKLFSQIHVKGGYIEGTGLGLAISKNLCHLMGGDIGVTKNQGRGTQFWFTVDFKRREPLSRSVSTVSKEIDFPILDKKRASLGACQVDSREHPTTSESDEEQPPSGKDFDLGFRRISGLFLVFYKNTNVRDVLKTYFERYKLKSEFITCNSYFGSSDPITDLVKYLESSKEFIRYVIIDYALLSVDPCDDLNQIRKKFIASDGISVLKIIKKKIGIHNLTVSTRCGPNDPVYIGLGIKPNKGLSELVSMYMSKPIRLTTIEKLLNRLSIESPHIRILSKSVDDWIQSPEEAKELQEIYDDRRISMMDLKVYEKLKKSQSLTKLKIPEEDVTPPKTPSPRHLTHSPRSGFQGEFLNHYKFPNQGLFGSKRCLIVDDNVVSRSVLARMVRGMGLQVSEVSNGLETLNLITQGTEIFDYIVTDIHMQGMNGINSTREIRKREKEMQLKETTIIGVSGDPSTFVTCMESGMNFCFNKPLQKYEILELEKIFSSKK